MWFTCRQLQIFADMWIFFFLYIPDIYVCAIFRDSYGLCLWTFFGRRKNGNEKRWGEMTSFVVLGVCVRELGVCVCLNVACSVREFYMWKIKSRLGVGEKIFMVGPWDDDDGNAWIFEGSKRRDDMYAVLNWARTPWERHTRMNYLIAKILRKKWAEARFENKNGRNVLLRLYKAENWT